MRVKNVTLSGDVEQEVVNRLYDENNYIELNEEEYDEEPSRKIAFWQVSEVDYSEMSNGIFCVTYEDRIVSIDFREWIYGAYDTLVCIGDIGINFTAEDKLIILDEIYENKIGEEKFSWER